MQFVPLWDSILDSAKIHGMDRECFYGWIHLMLCAQRHDNANGTLPDLKTLSFWCREEPETIKGWIASLTFLNLVDKRSQGLAIHDWDKWRCRGRKSSKERTAKWRNRLKARDASRDASRDANGDASRDSHGDVTETRTCDVAKQSKAELALLALQAPLAASPSDARPGDARLANPGGDAPSVGFPARPPHVAPDAGPVIPSKDALAIMLGKKKGPVE